MKKIGAILSLVGLLSQNSALAWVGGPYSNNTYDGQTDGTFGGTIRGTKTSGIFKFSQNSFAPYVSPFGDSIVYHGGLAYYGECYGQVDFDSSSVSGITNGANNGLNGADPNQSGFYRSIFGTGFGVQNGTDAGNATTNAFGNTNGPSSANSYWNGKITNKKLAVRFVAKGEMSFFGNASEVEVSWNTVSTGDLQDPRVGGDTGLNSNPTFAAGTAFGAGGYSFPGTGSTTQTMTRENNFPEVTDTVKIKVYGSRTAAGGAYAPANYAG